MTGGSRWHRIGAVTDGETGTASSGRSSARHPVRRVAAGILVCVAVVGLLAAMPALWASRNLLDTERFVSRAGPLVDDPSVRRLLVERLSSEVMSLIEPGRLFEEVLPERGELLAVPLTNAVEGFVRERVEELVVSDAFERIWLGALTTAHRTAIAVLRDDSTAVETSDGQVTLNLLPAVDAVLARIGDASPELLGRRLELPEISVDDVPATAIARIERALGVDLGEGFGQLTVYDDGKLELAQRVLDTFGRIVAVLVPATVVAAALSLWASVERRRTVLHLAAGAALVSVLVRRMTFFFDDEIVALAPTDAGRRAVAVAVDAFLSPLTAFAAWTLGIAAMVAAIAWVTRLSVAGVRTSRQWVEDHRHLLVASVAIAVVAALWVAN